MDSETNDELPEEFDGMDEDQMRIELEMLKLKLKAELGADFSLVEGAGKLPLEVEYQFLKQLLSFHRHLDKGEQISIREQLGNPIFNDPKNLTEAALEAEFTKVMALYETNFLKVEFLAEYPVALRYNFLTIELPDEQIDTLPPNSYLCITYEEAHPNPDYDQRVLTSSFFEHFFADNIERMILGDTLITPEDEEIDLEVAAELLHRFHGIFEDIKNWHIDIFDISSPKDLEPYNQDLAFGYVEGKVTFTIQHEGGTQEISGPFKLYNQVSGGWWETFSFVVHGFSWKRQ